MAKVLIIEDEAVISMMLEAWLADMGHEVVGPASTIQRARILVESAECEAALLDVSLNDALGYEMADILRQRGIPFAWGTGYNRRDIKPEYQDEIVLNKPYSPEAFGEAISALLATGTGRVRVL